ncbi:MAG: flippase-like domain-containing protein [Muribaculaceae bacterium]|nr:flippase-like domain-containing protein [Muribaculaceae bacterium]
MEEIRKKKRSILGIIMKYLVPLIITVGLCWVMFTKIDFGEMMHIIRTQCNFWWIGLMLFIGVWAHVFRAMRWRIQLRAIGVDAPLFILILSIFGTYAVNLVFPRLGELWRCTYVAQRQKAHFSSVFGSMLADRLADTLTVATLSLLTLILAYPQMTAYLKRPENTGLYNSLMGTLQSPWLWASLAAIIALLWWVLARKVPETDGKSRIANRINDYNRRLQVFAGNLWEGFAVVGKMRGKGRFLLYTVGIWGCFFLEMFSSFFAFPFTEGVFVQYGIVAVLFTFVISSISMGVPANGGIGPYQWACMLALACYGVPDNLGLVFGNLVLGMTTMMLILLGIFTFFCIMLDKRKNKAKSAA